MQLPLDVSLKIPVVDNSTAKEQIKVVKIMSLKRIMVLKIKSRLPKGI